MLRSFFIFCLFVSYFNICDFSVSVMCFSICPVDVSVSQGKDVPVFFAVLLLQLTAKFLVLGLALS